MREDANGHYRRPEKQFLFEFAVAGSRLAVRLAVGYFVDYSENLLDVPGTPPGKILVEPTASSLCDQSGGRLWSSSKTMQAQGRLNFTSETFLMYDTVARTFQESHPHRLPAPLPSSIPSFPACPHSRKFHDAVDKAGAKSRRDEIEPGESVPV